MVRLNLSDEVGLEAARRYGVSVIPALVMLDDKGEVIYQHSGTPDRKEVVAEFDRLMLKPQKGE